MGEYCSRTKENTPGKISNVTEDTYDNISFIQKGLPGGWSTAWPGGRVHSGKASV